MSATVLALSDSHPVARAVRAAGSTVNWSTSYGKFYQDAIASTHPLEPVAADQRFIDAGWFDDAQAAAALGDVTLGRRRAAHVVSIGDGESSGFIVLLT